MSEGPVYRIQGVPHVRGTMIRVAEVVAALKSEPPQRIAKRLGIDQETMKELLVLLKRSKELPENPGPDSEDEDSGSEEEEDSEEGDHLADPPLKQLFWPSRDFLKTGESLEYLASGAMLAVAAINMGFAFLVAFFFLVAQGFTLLMISQVPLVIIALALYLAISLNLIRLAFLPFFAYAELRRTRALLEKIQESLAKVRGD